MTAVPDLVVVGAGGHGRELLDVLAEVNRGSPTWNILGVVDDDPGATNLARLARLGVTHLGPVDWLEQSPTAYVLGIGTGAVRRRMVQRLDAAGCPDSPPVIHPGAAIGRDTEVGSGVVIFNTSVVTTNVRIGAHTHLNVANAVQHDSTIGEFSQLSPGVLVNGDCRIGNDVFVGSAAVITRGCSVGEHSRVGAGAVVLGDVRPGTTVVGAPARIPRLSTT